MSVSKDSQHSFMFPQALLAEHGPPTMDVLSNFMTNIDEKLSEQDRQIEDTLEKLVEATNALSSDNMYTNIKDAMDSLIHTSVLEECACLPPDSEDVNKLLKIVIDHLSGHLGSEGVVFQQLLNISSHEGMTLPVRAPKIENVAASSLSLNTISDTMEIENESLWEDVRSRIKKYFLDLLQSIKSDDSYTSLPKRVEILQSMCLLYPVVEVWSSYENQRSQKVVHLARHLLSPNSDENASECPSPNLQDICKKLELLVGTLRQLMQEDFHLSMFGVFDQEVDLKTALWKIYISKINEELQTHLDAIAAKKGDGNQMANGHAGNFPSMQSLTEVTSQTSFDDGLKTNISAPFVMSHDEVNTLLSIAESLSSLNNFYKSLCYKASWDTTLAFKLPVKGKGHLKGVLKHKKDAKNMSGPMEYDRRGVLPDAIPPPFGATPGMLANGGNLNVPSSDIVLETPASQKNKWNWFYLLDKFLPALVESYSSQTKETLLAKLAEEDTTWQQHHQLTSTPFVLADMKGGLFEGYQTCQITESTLFLVSSMAHLSPLEPLWMELPLRYFKSVLINISKECLQLLVTHLNKKLEEFIAQTASLDVTISIKELYVMLASVTSVVLFLTGSEPFGLEEESRQSFIAIETQFEELQSGLMQQVKAYHNHKIQFVVLQDAESHHWHDQKPFFEDERCSFSVHMWNLHIEKLRRELWAWCPPSQAVEIFRSVLGQSVKFLSSRYSRAKPSYKRTKQFRCDILLILSSTLEHLFAAASTIREVLPMSPSIQTHPMSQIHCPCTNLLSPLAVVTSPLPELYKIFKKGYGQRQRFREERNPDPSWMGWIWPELFERFQGLAEMPDSSAIFLTVKLLRAQQCPNYPLLIQSLLMRNSLLSCLFAREVGRKKETPSQYECDNNEPKFERFTDDQQSLLVNLAKLLSVCSDFPKSLSNFLLALVEREYSYSGGKFQDPLSLNNAPVWMNCILGLLRPSFVRCLEAVASQLVVSGTTSNNPPGFLENLRQLPCGCRIRSKGQMLMKKDEEEVFLDSCEAFLSCLSSEIASFPLSLRIFLQRLEKLLPDQNIKLPLKSVGMRIVIQIMLMFLNDEQNVRRNLKSDLSDKSLKHLCQTGRTSCVAISGQTPDNLDVPTSLLQEFRRQRGEWLTNSVHTMTEHFQRNELSQYQDIQLEDAALAYQEEYYLMLNQSVSCYPDVKEGLAAILRAVTNNVEWIQSIMEIPLMPVLRIPNKPLLSFEFDDISEEPRKQFNPVNQVNKIGNCPFTFDSISEVSVDFKGLLQSEIGLTKTSFQLLLSHRHDMQEEASLEESEKKAVRVLRAKYNLERADFV